MAMTQQGKLQKVNVYVWNVPFFLKLVHVVKIYRNSWRWQPYQSQSSSTLYCDQIGGENCFAKYHDSTCMAWLGPLVFHGLVKPHNTELLVLPFSSLPHHYQQTHFRDFNISEIHKAGSLGHGTAVPGHYDIDLVIYSRGIMDTYCNPLSALYWLAFLGTILGS